MKIKCEEYFYIPRWPAGVKSNHMVLHNPWSAAWLRNHSCTYHVSTQRQNIIDKTHTWQQCSVTISEDILTTKYCFNLRYISPLSIDNKLDNNNNTSALWAQKIACRACANPSSQSPSWHTFEATHAGSLSYGSTTHSGMKSWGPGEQSKR